MLNLDKSLAVIKIENNTEKYIEKIGVTYDGAMFQLFNVKNIGPKEIKELQVPTDYFNKKTILRIYNEFGHVYPIKEDVKKGDNLEIKVILNEVKENGSMDFIIVEW